MKKLEIPESGRTEECARCSELDRIYVTTDGDFPLCGNCVRKITFGGNSVWLSARDYHDIIGFIEKLLSQERERIRGEVGKIFPTGDIETLNNVLRILEEK